jgi:hypothetical protein
MDKNLTLNIDSIGEIKFEFTFQPAEIENKELGEVVDEIIKKKIREENLKVRDRVELNAFRGQLTASGGYEICSILEGEEDFLPPYLPLDKNGKIKDLYKKIGSSDHLNLLIIPYRGIG